MIPKLICFDIDNTLTVSKAPLEVDMAIALTALLRKAKVALVGGGKLEQFKKQLVDQLPSDAAFTNLYLLPTSGAALYEYALGEWSPVYIETLTEEDALTIRDALMEGAEKTGLVDFSTPSHGDRIEFRGSEVTLSVFGQEAPVEEKLAWDPDQTKREQLRNAIAPLLPQYDVKRGGSTSIDVTKHGVNKAFGIRRLSEHLNIPIADMLYIGDQLYPGGNDDVVKETGIKTQQVANPEETALVIKAMLV
ncbi:MAG TPA: HAD-IIB family hydrolase [Candidatus Paceibacterota bacterium]|nr:HAD-IIB family hydrolase [Candidatus Paceibacterota bacterium]